MKPWAIMLIFATVVGVGLCIFTVYLFLRALANLLFGRV